MSTSHPLAPLAVNFFSSVGSSNDKPMVVDQASTVPGVPVVASTKAPATSGKMPSETKSVSGTCSTMLINEPSAVTVSNRMAESTSSTKISSGGFKL